MRGLNTDGSLVPHVKASSTCKEERPGAIKVDSGLREFIRRSSRAETDLCWTCATCDNECPVNRATHTLRPRSLVRMAVFGMLDELMNLPDLWYCLTCKRCNQTCPTLTKPADLICFLREEAVRRKRVSVEVYRRYSDFFSRFQRVRWQTVSRCLAGQTHELSDEAWYEWLDTPVKASGETITIIDRLHRSKPLNEVSERTGASLCYTCSECSNACPIKRERALFDPQWIVRMVNLRQAEDILRSPAIWLCIGCRRCNDACQESVRPHDGIEVLRDLAIETGAVEGNIKGRLEEAFKSVYIRYVQEVDKILNREGSKCTAAPFARKVES